MNSQACGACDAHQSRRSFCCRGVERIDARPKSADGTSDGGFQQISALTGLQHCSPGLEFEDNEAGNRAVSKMQVEPVNDGAAWRGLQPLRYDIRAEQDHRLGSSVEGCRTSRSGSQGIDDLVQVDTW